MMSETRLSPWWRHAVILVLIGGFTVLIALAAKAYKDAPPIPEQVVDPSGRVLFTREDILGGQEVFLKYGLMENGTIWGHGAYLGPDFSAEYLRALGEDAAAWIARQRVGRDLSALTEPEAATVRAEVQRLLKQNRYDPERRVLIFTEPEARSYERQIERWADYFSHPTRNLGWARDVRFAHPRLISNARAGGLTELG
jgi:nitric oxide reductase subunit B